MKGSLIVCTLFQILAISYALEKQITVNVQPRRQDCFFEKIKEKESVEVDFQVIYGTNLDITFQAHDPNGRIIVADIKKTGNTHTFTTEMTGDYKFCFDNTFSTISDKTVFFELIIDDDEDSLENMQNLNPEDVYELKVQDIMEIIARVKSDISKSRQLQDIIRAIEARDRNIAEETNGMVSASSFLQVCAMFAVSVLHMIAVKSFFVPTSIIPSLTCFGLFKR